jgi:hypothetical protein
MSGIDDGPEMTSKPDLASKKDTREFWDFRNAPLHLYGPEEWKSYDPAMAAWLMHPDQEIRKCAIERLATATLHWDYEHSERARLKNQILATRVGRLLAELEKAQRQWPDVIPEFLRNLRWHGDDPHVSPLLLSWIAAQASQPQPPAHDGLIRGTQLLLARRETITADQMSQWIALLDEPSPYLRGCAAYLLGQNFEEDDDEGEVVGAQARDDRLPTLRTLMTLIGEKEIMRPGIAGPFWSPNHQEYPATEAEIINAALWMMDLLERRQGVLPDFGEMPYNDITFYLHELCCDDPGMMLRMLAGGFPDLALMTATEIRGTVAGVKPVLELLAADLDPDIAAAARAHLERHYVSEAPPRG